MQSPLSPPEQQAERNEKSVALRQSGNTALRAGNVEEALNLYTEALKYNPQCHLTYSNRACAQNKRNNFEAMLEDARMCEKLAPNFIKAYAHQAVAYKKLDRYEEAIAAADKGFREAWAQGSAPSSASAFISNMLAAWSECRRCFLSEALEGLWEGTTHETIGGYKKILQFLPYEQQPHNLIETVVLAEHPEIYSLMVPPPPELIDGETLSLGIDVVPANCEKNAHPVPSIFRLTYQTADGSRVEYDGRRRKPADASAWQLEMCSPFVTAERPREFEGPGYILLKAVAQKPEMPRPSAAVLQMKFEQQFMLYLRKVLELSCPVKLRPLKDDEDCTRLMASALKSQEELNYLAYEFPADVSAIAEQLFANVEEAAAARGKTAAEVAANVAEFEATLTAECQQLLRATRRHINATGLELLQFAPLATTTVTLDILSGTRPDKQQQLLPRSFTPRHPIAAMENDAASAQQQQQPQPQAEAPGCRGLRETCRPKELCSWVREHKTAVIVTAAAVGGVTAAVLYCRSKRR